MAKNEKLGAGGRLHPTEIMFDRAIDVTGMPPREEGEAVEDYGSRKDFGPNTKGHIKTALEAAERLDQTGATSAMHSARLHHDNPAPPDSRPLKP